jgi:hypothetical protein
MLPEEQDGGLSQGDRRVPARSVSSALEGLHVRGYRIEIVNASPQNDETDEIEGRLVDDTRTRPSIDFCLRGAGANLHDRDVVNAVVEALALEIDAGKTTIVLACESESE